MTSISLARYLTLALAALGTAACSLEEVTIGSEGGSRSSAGLGGGSSSPDDFVPPCGLQTLASNLENPGQLLYSDGYVYVVTQHYPHQKDCDGALGTILRTPVAGGPTEVVADNLPSVGQTILSVEAGSFFWADSGCSKSFSTVWRLPISGGTPVAVYEAADSLHGTDDPEAVVADGSHLYVATASSIKRMDFDGSNSADLVAEPASLLQVDDQNLYWVEWVAGSSYRSMVKKIPLTGGPIVTLLDEDVGYLYGFNLRGKDLYAVQEGDTLPVKSGGYPAGTYELYQIPVDEAVAPTVLVDALPGVGSVAIDSSGLYWTGDSASPFAADAAQQNQARALYVQRLGSLGSSASAIEGSTAEKIGPRTAVAWDSMVPCDGGICWTDVVNRNVVRYPECE